MDTQKIIDRVCSGITRHLEQGGTYSDLVDEKLELKLSTIRWIHQRRTDNPGIRTLGKIARKLGIGK